MVDDIIELRFYETVVGKVPAREWLDSIRPLPAYGRIMNRLEHVRRGAFGDHRSVGEGVTELRLDFGPGYRIYYGRDGNEFVILLIRGTKGSQQRDIKTAETYWSEYNA